MWQSAQSLLDALLDTVRNTTHSLVGLHAESLALGFEPFLGRDELSKEATNSNSSSLSSKILSSNPARLSPSLALWP